MKFSINKYLKILCNHHFIHYYSLIIFLIFAFILMFKRVSIIIIVLVIIKPYHLKILFINFKIRIDFKRIIYSFILHEFILITLFSLHKKMSFQINLLIHTFITFMKQFYFLFHNFAFNQSIQFFISLFQQINISNYIILFLQLEFNFLIINYFLVNLQLNQINLNFKHFLIQYFFFLILKFKYSVLLYVY